MPEINGHDDDIVGHAPLTGEPITRRQWRERVESEEMERDAFILELRRMLESDLTDAQLTTLQRLFKSLGAEKNPLTMVSWWEGQIDFAAHLRQRDAALRDAAAGPVAEPTSDIPETLLGDPEGSLEVESAVVEGTLDRHDFEPDPDSLYLEDGTCVFAVSVAGTEGGVFVCGLPYDAPPHRPLGGV